MRPNQVNAQPATPQYPVWSIHLTPVINQFGINVAA